MLRALGDPVSFLVLLASYAIAVTLHGGLQAAAAGGQPSLDPRHHVDPFGAVAGLIAGVGWARPAPAAPGHRRRTRLSWVLLVGTAGNLAVAVAALLGFRLLAGGLPLVSATLLQYGVSGGNLAERGLLLFALMNLYVGLLSLIPLPPLDGGRLLFGLAPRTPGWQRAEYRLVEQNLGLAAVLALLLLPLGGPQAFLPHLLDLVAGPIARAVTGG